MDWQIVCYNEVSLYRGPFHIFYYRLGKEHRLLYRYIQVSSYIQVPQGTGGSGLQLGTHTNAPKKDYVM